MNLKLAGFLLAMTSLLLAEQAQAQTYGNKLRGITKIGILAETPGEYGKECQITAALMRDAFMYPASGSRLVVLNSTVLVPYIYFNINTLLFKQNQLCVSNIDMSLLVVQEVKLQASGRAVFSDIQLWTDGSMQSSFKAGHAQSVRDTIEEKTKKFITDWNLDNK